MSKISPANQNIPDGWVLTTIGGVCSEINSGSGFPKRYQGKKEGDYPFAKVGDISRYFRAGITKIETADHYISEAVRHQIKAKIFPKNTIVFPKIGEALKGNYRVIVGREMLFDNNVMGVSPNPEIANYKFVFYFLMTQDFGRFSVATAVPSVRRGDVESISICLPPLNVQNRIVAKIEALFSELDKGVESLKTAREQLKIYRQAVLKHAFEGKLTARWREENADKLEPPEQLLARIQQEREARYQQQLQEWKAAVKAWEKNGKEGKKPGKPSKPLSFTADESDKYPLPTGWTTMKLGDLAAESVLGKMLDKEKNTGTMCPYLGNINVRWGAFDIANLKSMKIEDSEKERCGLHKGDLVVCEGGEPGRCAIWKGDSGKMFIQKALHRVRFTESYDPNFAYYYIVYAAATQRIATYFTGTTIKHLTGTGLQKVEFPLCSIAEQKEIVSLLDKQLTSIEALDSEISTGLRKSETLRQATLKKAFSGHLVPQGSNDQHATVLAECNCAHNSNDSSLNFEGDTA